MYNDYNYNESSVTNLLRKLIIEKVDFEGKNKTVILKKMGISKKQYEYMKNDIKMLNANFDSSENYVKMINKGFECDIDINNPMSFRYFSDVIFAYGLLYSRYMSLKETNGLKFNTIFYKKDYFSVLSMFDNRGIDGFYDYMYHLINKMNINNQFNYSLTCSYKVNSEISPFRKIRMEDYSRLTSLRIIKDTICNDLDFSFDFGRFKTSIGYNVDEEFNKLKIFASNSGLTFEEGRFIDDIMYRIINKESYIINSVDFATDVSKIANTSVVETQKIFSGNKRPNIKWIRTTISKAFNVDIEMIPKNFEDCYNFLFDNFIHEEILYTILRDLEFRRRTACHDKDILDYEVMRRETKLSKATMKILINKPYYICSKINLKDILTVMSYITGIEIGSIRELNRVLLDYVDGVLDIPSNSFLPKIEPSFTFFHDVLPRYYINKINLFDICKYFSIDYRNLLNKRGDFKDDFVKNILPENNMLLAPFSENFKIRPMVQYMTDNIINSDSSVNIKILALAGYEIVPIIV